MRGKSQPSPAGLESLFQQQTHALGPQDQCTLADIAAKAFQNSPARASPIKGGMDFTKQPQIRLYVDFKITQQL